MKNKPVFIFILLQCLSVLASTEYSKILNKYTNAQNVEVNIVKTDEKLTLGTKSVSEGFLKFAKDKIYIFLQGDKKIEFFYQKHTIWLVEYPDQDFDKNGHRKVAIFKKSTPVLMSGLINLFSNQKKFLKEFKQINEKIENDTLTVEFNPTQKNLKSLTLVISLSERTINQVIFIDDVDTKTTLQLDKLKLNKNMSSSVFDFKELKNDEVTKE